MRRDSEVPGLPYIMNLKHVAKSLSSRESRSAENLEQRTRQKHMAGGSDGIARTGKKDVQDPKDTLSQKILSLRLCICYSLPGLAIGGAGKAKKNNVKLVKIANET